VPKFFLTAWMAAFLVMLPGAFARADAETAKKALEARLKGERIESVKPTPFAGLYEVVVASPRGSLVMYTDEKAQFLFAGGALLDVRTTPYKDLTRETVSRLNAALINGSLKLAVKRVKGNGKRTLITFEDPNCPYCKALQKELVQLTDVTIYTFLWPFLAESSLTKSQAVWCAKDPGKAFEDLMLREQVPPVEKAGCEYRAEPVHEMARRLGLQGTPALFLADGTEYTGPRTAQALEQALNEAKSASGAGR
jgi:thiol:disulfide interchange protein DsbC